MVCSSNPWSRTRMATPFRDASLASLSVGPSHGRVFDLPLEQREEFFFSVLENLFDGVLVTDPAGHVLYLNAPMERIGGWSSAEVQGKSVWEVFFEPEHWLRGQHLLPKRAAEQSEEYEIEGKRKDGQRRVWRMCATPFLNSTGEFLGIIGVCHDITNKHRLARDNALLREEIAAEVNLGHLVGSGPAIRRWSSKSRSSRPPTPPCSSWERAAPARNWWRVPSTSRAAAGRNPWCG